MRLGLIGVSVGLFLAPGAGAIEQSRASAEVFYSSTSDGIADRGVVASYRDHRRDFFWAYPDEADEGWDWGARAEQHWGANPRVDFTGTRGTVLVGRKFSPYLHADLSAGGHRLAGRVGSSSQSETIMVGEAELFFSPIDELRFSAELARDWIYAELIQPGSVTDQISASSLVLRLSASPAERVAVRAGGRYRALSDGNRGTSADLGVLYGISTGVPWIWAGVGVEHLSHTESPAGYWSPSKFWAFGTRFEATVPLIGELSLATGLNLNLIREDALDLAEGYYGTASLQYGNREDLHFLATYTRIASIRDAVTWTMNGFALTVVSPL